MLGLQERPQHLQPRVLLLRNLMRQSQGREADVPALALQALREAGEASRTPRQAQLVPGGQLQQHMRGTDNQQPMQQSGSVPL